MAVGVDSRKWRPWLNQDQLGIDIRTDRNDVVTVPQFRYGFGISSSIGGRTHRQKSNKPPMICRRRHRNHTMIHDDAGATIVVSAAAY